MSRFFFPALKRRAKVIATLRVAKTHPQREKKVATHITVLKFGGTSIQDRAAFERVAQIVKAKQSATPVVVVSAMSGVTDALIESFRSVSTRGVAESLVRLQEHFERHLQVGRGLSVTRFARLHDLVEASREEITELLSCAAHDHGLNMRTHDAIASHGERLAANLLTSVLKEHGVAAEYVDARRCVITNESHGNAEPLLDELRRRAAAELLPFIVKKQIPVLGGFIGATLNGVTTTLGRGSSDYSATLIGAALHAREIEIWTDVDGVQTADPRLVQSTRTVPHISYAEAAQLAKLGARVMHPKMIEPVIADQITIRILNSHAPEQPGTLISAESPETNGKVKAIAHKISGKNAIVGCIGHGLKINFLVEPDAVGAVVRQLHAAIFE
jgi:aspartate kinase